MVRLLLALVFCSRLAWADESTLSVRAMTFNVGLLRVLGQDLVNYVDARASEIPSRLADHLVRDSVDLVCLQEVWQSDHAKAITNELEKRGYEVASPPVRVGFGLGHGLLFAMRKDRFKWATDAKTSIKFFAFQNAVGGDRFAKKGFFLVHIVSLKAPKSELLVGGTHMQVVNADAKTGNAADESEAKSHEAQVKQILKMIEEEVKAKHNLPLLFMGDFNVGPKLSSKNYALFFAETPGLKPAVDYQRYPIATWNREKNVLIREGKFPNDPVDVIDHVVVRDGERGRWTTEAAKLVFEDEIELKVSDKKISSPLSDHFANQVNLKLIHND